MARRGRGNDDNDVRVQPPTGALFLSLPDLAHSSIASFLPGGNRGNDSRLRMSEVSRQSYGGSLTRMLINFVEDSSATRLAALLRRHGKLARLVANHKAISMLCLAIAQGCCR